MVHFLQFFFNSKLVCITSTPVWWVMKQRSNLCSMATFPCFKAPKWRSCLVSYHYKLAYNLGIVGLLNTLWTPCLYPHSNTVLATEPTVDSSFHSRFILPCLCTHSFHPYPHPLPTPHPHTPTYTHPIVDHPSCLCTHSFHPTHTHTPAHTHAHVHTYTHAIVDPSFHVCIHIASTPPTPRPTHAGTAMWTCVTADLLKPYSPSLILPFAWRKKLWSNVMLIGGNYRIICTPMYHVMGEISYYSLHIYCDG